MKFDDLDARMRIYEEHDDRCVLPGMYMVARIDGRSFTRLTKEVHNFEAPFDIRFRHSASKAASQLNGLSIAAKNELLFQYGTNFNDLPQWQRRGVGLYWEKFDKQGVNPKTGKTETAKRRRIKRNVELPMRDEFSAFVKSLLAEGHK